MSKCHKPENHFLQQINFKHKWTKFCNKIWRKNTLYLLLLWKNTNMTAHFLIWQNCYQSVIYLWNDSVCTGCEKTRELSIWSIHTSIKTNKNIFGMQRKICTENYFLRSERTLRVWSKRIDSDAFVLNIWSVSTPKLLVHERAKRVLYKSERNVLVTTKAKTNTAQFVQSQITGSKSVCAQQPREAWGQPW